MIVSAEGLKNCPICSWKLEENRCRMLPYPSEETEGRPHSIVFCENCGIGIAWPRWGDDEIERYYSCGDYWGKTASELLSPKRYPVPYALAVSRWRIIEPLFEKRRQGLSMLDIGAGHGFMGMVAAKSDKIHLANYTCIEQDRYLMESLNTTWAKHLLKSTITVTNHIDNTSGIFDCIVLSQILEHLSDPKDLLKRAFANLASDGFIYVDVPNQDYLFKKDVFPHLLFFSSASLKLLLQECGLKVSSIACYGNDMNASPLNCRRKIRPVQLLEQVISRFKAVLPEAMIRSFYSKYFEMDRQNESGIWIRALGTR